MLSSALTTTLTMRTLRDFFIRVPPPTPRTQDTRIEAQTLDEAPASSPQLEPPRSSITIDLTQDDNRKNEEDISAFTRQDLSPPRPASDKRPETFAPGHSFLNTESIPLPSSLNGSFNASQRILKDGQEVVISSDGDDTDSISSLEDPDVLFAPKNKAKNTPPPPPKKYLPNKALLAQLSAPTKYKYTIDSLVHDAMDDDEIEANVAKARATFVELQQNGAQVAAGGSKKGLNEGMLASALGGDSGQGPGLQRLFDAVRRTEALEQNRNWRFFEYGQMTAATPKFPSRLFPAGSSLAGLKGCSRHIQQPELTLTDLVIEPESRARILQSGMLEFAASLQRLPDEFLLWLIRSSKLITPSLGLALLHAKISGSSSSRTSRRVEEELLSDSHRKIQRAHLPRQPLSLYIANVQKPIGALA